MFSVLTRQPCEQAGLRTFSRTPAVIALVVLLLSFVVLVTITLIQTHHKEVLLPGLKYGIVLDAGSSRTTVYLYQWPGEKENNTGVVSQTYKCSVKGSGISSYGNNPQDVPKAFEDCMQKVKEQIPAHLLESTCVYLGATAGMRLLRLQNDTAAKEILVSIQNYFKSQPFDFRGAQIISGQEEGIYGWITANYLMGNFLEKDLWHMWVHPNGVATTGALDLGGASTQISFAVGEKVELNTSDIVRVSLYGYAYALYTRSFQCYGRNEAEKRFLAMLLQNSATKTNVINPCYPRDYSTSLAGSRIFDSPCTEALKPRSYDPDDTITFEGTGDPLLCSMKVASLFAFKACRGRDINCFDGIYQPGVKGPFVAFAGFFYTVSALNLTGSFSLNTFNSSTWDFCSKSWGQLPQLLPRFDEVYARSYCFSAHYIYHLLVSGYRFTEDTWPQIYFKKEVENTSIAWSLGYMLSLTNQIPAEMPLVRLPLKPPTFMSTMAFFTGVALLSLAFLVMYLYMSARKQHHSQHVLDHTVDSE
ncbi:ectonucleoside triphosphate diphosphohydrolase 3 [Sturnira hondurensis]|uniref:ectonucleoside triphosphate diphosphohydrolase 3 n=1 Tax=Sturnira hondurensis TaxID=192404 RepID=UPI00187AD32D|nr:ectonucleoside triphosphate diphosphohydrolase 3 [Sturnira hondurensis]XP_036886453.1 ectonucleoside triphosphate diphosphohydrolase 3 [Sturnira hondurensis]XP_036886454.1 ectonucleoside triphosphate diphosphohydrolase 3 [Sturnira hondurensis]XP_036886455.1 ectonucleoside triphosphate diphosphohydrolase 3 [Sturnira hondurensis]XP_036886456.1 ectonucleoside triphosphate diphosphohydrolase 3 [Sturnira hondurensis]XP_036886457.1 ectonucleoside triphosphate diphosphohydrolase 3 [Sturnira hondur